MRKELWKSSAFRRDDSGNIAVLFAIVLVPLVSFMGAAVDYTRANQARSKMQASLDSAALMVARDVGSGSVSQSQVSAQAQAYFKAMYTGPDAANVSVNAAYTSSPGTGTTIALSSSGTIPTEFLKVVGFPTLPLNSSSSSTFGSNRLRVALVLDNTGSMADNGKMNALIPAAQKLIDQLKGTANTPEDVYISVIPFSKDVNVGVSNYNQPWLDWTDWDADPANDSYGTCQMKKYTSRTDCLQGNNKNKRVWTPDHTQWKGCVTDRTQDYDVLNTAPTASNQPTLFVPEQYSECPVPLMPLSSDWTALKAGVGTMTPNGNTNQAIGLVWGWHSLTQGLPLNAPPEDPQYAYKKVIILMTDGLNTQNRWTTDPATIDAREATLCSNIKNAGITIYTVQVNTSGDPTQAVLQNCASGPSNFVVLTSSNQIMAAFSSIATSISKLRLAR